MNAVPLRIKAVARVAPSRIRSALHLPINGGFVNVPISPSSGCGGSGLPVKIMFTGGGVAKLAPYSAAVEVIRGARVINGKGKPVTPITVVACKRRIPVLGRASIRLGVMLEVVDPGKKHDSFILKGGRPEQPMLLKSSAGPNEMCLVAHEECAGCYHMKTKKKR